MWQASGRFTEAGISRELFEEDVLWKECNLSDGNRWIHEPLYAVRAERYPAHTVLQPGVESYARNVGHGQNAGGSLAGIKVEVIQPNVSQMQL